jgi:hypothetical protein
MVVAAVIVISLVLTGLAMPLQGRILRWGRRKYGRKTMVGYYLAQWRQRRTR